LVSCSPLKTRLVFLLAMFRATQQEQAQHAARPEAQSTPLYNYTAGNVH
jgi:hypothetical protein